MWLKANSKQRALAIAPSKNGPKPLQGHRLRPISDQNKNMAEATGVLLQQLENGFIDKMGVEVKPEAFKADPIEGSSEEIIADAKKASIE